MKDILYIKRNILIRLLGIIDKNNIIILSADEFSYKCQLYIITDSISKFTSIVRAGLRQFYTYAYVDYMDGYYIHRENKYINRRAYNGFNSKRIK